MVGPRATLRGALPNGCARSIGIVTLSRVEVIVDAAVAVDVANHVRTIGRRAADRERRGRRVVQVDGKPARHRVDCRQAPAANDPFNNRIEVVRPLRSRPNGSSHTTVVVLLIGWL